MKLAGIAMDFKPGAPGGRCGGEMGQQAWLAGGWFAIVAGGVGGCSSFSVSNPWSFDRPPAVAAAGDSARPVRGGRTVIAVARFGNPSASQLRWRDVGAGMSDALRRALLNEGKFEVRIDPQIERLLSQSAPRQRQVNGSAANVDFIVTGTVTDFHHTAALPAQVSRRGLFGTRSEAVVAIQWSIVDARTRRVVAADHIYGTARAGKDPQIKEMYSGVAFGSYLFWSTPLGRASRQAVERTMDRIREKLPSYAGDPRIVKHDGMRKITVVGGWAWGLTKGQEYYVYAAHPDEVATAAAPRPVYDPDTGRPLMVRINRVGKESSTAWLLGKPPVEVDLLGAFLSRDQPASPEIPAPGADAVLADVGEEDG